MCVCVCVCVCVCERERERETSVYFSFRKTQLSVFTKRQTFSVIKVILFEVL